MKFIVVHKLTNKPVRTLQAPHDIVVFDLLDFALEVRDRKNKFMRGNFYKVCALGSTVEIK